MVDGWLTTVTTFQFEDSNLYHLLRLCLYYIGIDNVACDMNMVRGSESSNERHKKALIEVIIYFLICKYLFNLHNFK